MNPTSNKSDFEDLTTNLKDLAYSYLEKYSPSKQQLKIYLLKKYLTKIKGTKSKKEVSSIIDEILKNLEQNKIVNDELYSDSKARMFLRRGYSLNKIHQSLMNKGIDSKKIIEFCLKSLKDKNLEIYNIDATVICEVPKINPHRDLILKSLSKILKTTVERIGLKATTSEQIGIIGKNKAIAVQSFVNLIEVS